MVLSGHTHNVRALVWHYEIPWLLLSGSWDGTIRVWDIRGASTTASTASGSGSTTTSTSASGAISGSGSISGSDHHHHPSATTTSASHGSATTSTSTSGATTIAGQCVAVVYDHHADVYGLASHPLRPFVFASSSRDTSLRFWGMDEVLWWGGRGRGVALRCVGPGRWVGWLGADEGSEVC